MAIRRFADNVEAIARAWRAQVLSAESWRVVGPRTIQHGEASGFFVTANGVGGYAKPGRNQPPVTEHPRAAHEKIAADLAHDLGLPVPPCTLWERPSPGAGERFCCVSLEAFVPIFQWRDVLRAPGLAGRLANESIEAASAMVAFDTWLGNGDRVNEGNLLVQEDVSGPVPVARFAYIDFANAFTWSWGPPSNQAEAWKFVGATGPYPVGSNRLDLTLMAKTRDAIRAVPQAAIRDIVDRVPPSFLPAARKDAIMKGLEYRQQSLDSLLRSAFPGLT